MNIAIFSPSQNPYSETFIQAHKKYLSGKVFYFFGSKGRIKLEGQHRLVTKTTQWRYQIICKLKKYARSYVNEQSVLASLKKQNIDVILVEYGTHAFNLISLFKSSSLPVVVHFHGYDASVYKVIEECNNYNEVFRLATFTVAVSRKMENMLLNLGCPREKLIYNVYGPEPEFETVVPNFSKKQFIGIGRFTDKKAPYYTIMALAKVINKHPEVLLLLAGNGALLNTCKNLVKQYQLENNVKFLGIITPSEFRKLLSESLAFIQHSITALDGDMEGTPLAVLEASVAGLPIISTNHAGIPDVIHHGETGLLCEEHDINGMADNMLKVLDNVNYAQQMGASGKQNILKNFNMQIHIKGLQRILEDAVNDY